MIPLFGFESLNISIEVIPMMLAGILLAPGYCYIIGIAIDLVGLLVNPTGFPFLGFTLNAVLQCLIPSLIVTTIKENRLNYLEKVIKILLIVLVVGACSYVFSLNQVTISNNVVTISTSFKIIMSIICVIMIAILFIVMHFCLHHAQQPFRRQNSTKEPLRRTGAALVLLNGHEQLLC